MILNRDLFYDLASHISMTAELFRSDVKITKGKDEESEYVLFSVVNFKGSEDERTVLENKWKRNIKEAGLTKFKSTLALDFVS